MRMGGLDNQEKKENNLTKEGRDMMKKSKGDTLVGDDG